MKDAKMKFYIDGFMPAEKRHIRRQYPLIIGVLIATRIITMLPRPIFRIVRIAERRILGVD
jgi:hypothetical protein